MVLANNEWLHVSDNVPRATATNSTSASSANMANVESNGSGAGGRGSETTPIPLKDTASGTSATATITQSISHDSISNNFTSTAATDTDTVAATAALGTIATSTALSAHHTDNANNEHRSQSDEGVVGAGDGNGEGMAAAENASLRFPLYNTGSMLGTIHKGTSIMNPSLQLGMQNNNREFIESLLSASFSETYANSNSNVLTAATTTTNSIANANASNNVRVAALVQSAMLGKQTKGAPKAVPGAASTVAETQHSSPTMEYMSSICGSGSASAASANGAGGVYSINTFTATGGGLGNNQFLSSLGITQNNAAPNNMMDSTKTLIGGGMSSFTPFDAHSLKTTSSLMSVPHLGLNANAAASAGSAMGGGSTAVSTSAPDFDTPTQAKIVLLCEANSHPFQTRTIILTPNVECKVGRLIAKSKACESNAIFDCKVLSRTHAVLWYGEDSKFWVKDTKSSNGTFINDNKLGVDPAELRFGDVVKFGVDVLENSRKEVHGCIIACVKLYYPDGREAISIDSVRQQHSSDNHVNFEELHQLNQYIQEAAQREKTLKTKLSTLQNVIEATRRHSTTSWSGAVTEDQLLGRISTLEKKLLFLEKNVPENSAKAEALKMIEERAQYQITAKDAIEKVYAERCEVMQMLAKMESAYTTADNECKILRDQIMSSKQSLQELHGQKLRLESEYTEYREEVLQRQTEARSKEEHTINDLQEQLRKRNIECLSLKRQVSEILAEQEQAAVREEMNNKNKKLQKNDQSDVDESEEQAIAKLDAAFADMDLGDDDEDEDDAASEDIDSDIVVTVKNRDTVKMDHKDLSATKPKDVDGEESAAVLKWLHNSDLKQNDGSLAIISAIYNDYNQSSDEEDITEATKLPKIFGNDAVGAGAGASSKSAMYAKPFMQKCKHLTAMLNDLEKNLAQLEADANKSETNEDTIVNVAACGEFNSDTDDDANVTDFEMDLVKKDIKIKTPDDGKKSGTASCDEQLNCQNNFKLMQNTIKMLRVAYNDFCESVECEKLQVAEIKYLHSNQTKQSGTAAQKDLANQLHASLMSLGRGKQQMNDTNDLAAAVKSERNDSDSEQDNSDEEDDVSEATTAKIFSAGDAGYEHQVLQLSAQLQRSEVAAQETLNMVENECGTLRAKILELTQIIELLRYDKQKLELTLSACKIEQKNSAMAALVDEQLEQVEMASGGKEDVIASIDNAVNDAKKQQPKNLAVQNVSGKNLSAAEESKEYESTSTLYERQVQEEIELINNCAVQREEEFILYKERLQRLQLDNLQLRTDIATIQMERASQHPTIWGIQFKDLLPIIIIFIAGFIYFLLSYL